jgi:hypothetical protein
VSVFGQNYMGMNEVASSILPMLETVIQGDETEVAGPRSLIWVWSVARLKVSEDFRDVERRGACLVEVQRARCDRRDWRKKNMWTEECSVTMGNVPTGVYGDWKLPFLVQEVDPLLT